MKSIIYLILWAILTALVCFAIYELRQDELVRLGTGEEDVTIVDKVASDNDANSNSKEITDQDAVNTNPESENNDSVLDKQSASPIGKIEGQEFVEKVYIEFSPNSTKFASNPKFDKYLDSLIVIMKSDKYKILLEGHSDQSKSKMQDNYQVGMKRAEFIKNVLVNKGVSESYITTTSLGDQSPRIEGNTPEAKALNRRVELFIKLKK